MNCETRYSDDAEVVIIGRNDVWRQANMTFEATILGSYRRYYRAPGIMLNPIVQDGYERNMDATNQ